MFIARELLPTWLLVISWAGWLLVLGTAVRYADWRAIYRVSQRQHVLLGSSIACVALWLISVRAIDGLWLHLLGVSCFTMLLGWRFAIIGGSMAVIAHCLIIGQPIVAAAPAWVLTIFIPTTTTRYLVYRLRRLRSRNLFIYMLGAGFFGGALCAALVAAGTMLAFAAIGKWDWIALCLEQWPLLLLMMFPEGFINGMVITTLTVFYPQLVKTFDEDHYLGEG
ncbi:energy-coupling factor ABC transporter permease [Mangrovimicrobium sediminis]|uniref:energy-coupling factor ABC transporter permease n=1 Tax=Mangrovimicrobium sediminis TaxID=2562682 RepID=UPI001436B20E|nr:energy-coupling factor ABC transporter permease [Haliea sp. SAOS-164]